MTGVTPAGGAALELDCRGMRCPLPVIELAKRIGDVPVGEIVAVVSTDPAARVDIPAWCRMRSQEHVAEQETTDGAQRHLVRRTS